MYNQILQAELNKGLSIVEAGRIAREKFAAYTRQQTKGRTINDSKSGAIRI